MGPPGRAKPDARGAALLRRGWSCPRPSSHPRRSTRLSTGSDPAQAPQARKGVRSVGLISSWSTKGPDGSPRLRLHIANQPEQRRALQRLRFPSAATRRTTHVFELAHALADRPTLRYKLAGSLRETGGTIEPRRAPERHTGRVRPHVSAARSPRQRSSTWRTPLGVVPTRSSRIGRMASTPAVSSWAVDWGPGTRRRRSEPVETGQRCGAEHHRAGLVGRSKAAGASHVLRR
jgi:hypothetical protein